MSKKLDLATLSKAIANNACAIRTHVRLQPAGGQGDKIFPPTYSAEKGKIKYALETRRVDGEDRETVLLDSVQSQANRMEECLFEAWENGDIDIPVINVDFSAEKELEDLDRISTLHAPHRIADALVRDSVDKDNTLFRDTDAGKAFTDANPKNATAVYRFCPTALLFGVWDSTGPKGGMGSKFQRAIVSEIVGVGVKAGVKTSSRIDPAGIQANVEVYKSKKNPADWTIERDLAQKKKEVPVPFVRSTGEGKGKPSAINHSNIAPSIDSLAGGITCDYALQTTVISVPALRRLRFVADYDAKPIDRPKRLEAEKAVRTTIAALGIAALALQRQCGYDLRSRSLLVPEAATPLQLELVPIEGGEGTRYDMDAESACKLLAEASAAAAKLGFTWEREPLALKPSAKLAALIRESRRLAAAGEAEEEG